MYIFTCFQTILSFHVVMVLQISYAFNSPKDHLIGSNSDSTDEKSSS